MPCGHEPDQDAAPSVVGAVGQPCCYGSRAVYVVPPLQLLGSKAVGLPPRLLLHEYPAVMPPHQLTYPACCMCVSLQLLGRKAVDYPPRAFLYEYPEDTPPHQLGKGGLYGKGFSYSHRLADDPGIDRSDIEQRIRVR